MELNLVCTYKSQLPPSGCINTLTFLTKTKYLKKKNQVVYIFLTKTKNYSLHLDNKYLFPEHPIYCQATFQVQDTELTGGNGSPCSTH